MNIQYLTSYDAPVCSNYVPVTDGDTLLAFFGVQRDFSGEAPPEAYPTDLAPFIRLVNGQRTADAGRFGLLPPWRREVRYGTHTYNARSETVHSLPSYKESWRYGLRCVIPAKAVYEPRYNDDGSNERWRIEKEDGTPFGVAGVYTEWVENGEEKFSFSMLTVNCDEHAFYSQFHAPGKEKRMPVFLDPEDYDTWMSCPVREAAGFFQQWPGPFNAFAEPRTPRVPKVPKAPQAPKADAVTKPPKPTPAPKPPPPPPAQGDLF
ncbi:SOS response-associated peptidase [Ramlibacter sp. G-1-2-2]|uniref:Abasic site processing protein n=1 Tax=Ramlibacter agri TaxID=2728837 RepID=A0A848H4S0_9BURK|nr:SOS response-associated peptidase family protein [Ramlibacter agri]NML44509.1 SOS response-associated peptidase [Ramlibacter agri]